jgi:hypothetical protein
MPIDPVYAWSIVLEPAEDLIRLTAGFIEELAREVHETGHEFSQKELESRFLDFFDRMVNEGKLQRLADADPTMGRHILGPRRWLRAQKIRITRLVAYWQEQGGPDGLAREP